MSSANAPDRLPDRDPRALSALDWGSFAFAAIALFLAPLLAGAFSTPSPGLLSAGVGVALVIAFVGDCGGCWRFAGMGSACGGRRCAGTGGSADPARRVGGPVAAAGSGAGVWPKWSCRPACGPVARRAYQPVDAGQKGAVRAAFCADWRGFAYCHVDDQGVYSVCPCVGRRISGVRRVSIAGFSGGLSAFNSAGHACRVRFNGGFSAPSPAWNCHGSANRRADDDRFAGGILALAIGLVVWLLLAFWSGAAKGRGKPIAAGLAILLLCAALSSGSLRARVVGKGANATLASARAASDSQAHSGAFRKQTWVGTVRMAKANPIFGAGIGGYETAYPRYTIVAFTAHAHNSFLQWTAETGIPGILFLLTALAAVAAFALNVLYLGRGNAAPVVETAETPEILPGLPLIAVPRLLLTGLLAALLASMVKSFIDSDWYIVATLFTLSAILALTVGLARDLAPLTTQTPRPLSKGMLGVGALLAVFLLWRGAATGLARYNVATVMESRQITPEGADSLQSAASADPFDPEPPLLMASYQADIGQNDAALASLNHAAKIAPVGKTYYRLAQFYARSNRLPEAIAAFEQAQNREPRNVQNLRALGDALLKNGQNAQAAAVYRLITDLENSDFGKIRALPEMIEPELVYAHLGLAQIAFAAQNDADADAEYQKALELLRIYWRDRKNGYYDSLSPTRHAALTDACENALTQKIQTVSRLNPPDSAAQKAALTTELAAFQKDKAEDAAPVLMNLESGTAP